MTSYTHLVHGGGNAHRHAPEVIAEDVEDGAFGRVDIRVCTRQDVMSVTIIIIVSSCDVFDMIVD